MKKLKVIRVNHGKAFGKYNWYTFYCPKCGKILESKGDCPKCREKIDWSY